MSLKSPEVPLGLPETPLITPRDPWDLKCPHLKVSDMGRPRRLMGLQKPPALETSCKLMRSPEAPHKCSEAPLKTSETPGTSWDVREKTSLKSSVTLLKPSEFEHNLLKLWKNNDVVDFLQWATKCHFYGILQNALETPLEHDWYSLGNPLKRGETSKDALETF